MANKKANKPAVASKKAQQEVAHEPIEAVVAEQAPVIIKEERKRTPKLDDSVCVAVQSNVFGGLTYINSRTGDSTKWEDFGDVQTLTIGDLRAMRGTQSSFFKNNWIFIKEVEDAGYEDMQPADVYKALMVSQYYQDVIEPDNFYEIFDMDNNELARRISMMTNDAKFNLVVAANDAIRDGVLDSLQKIRVIEDTIGCELVKIE